MGVWLLMYRARRKAPVLDKRQNIVCHMQIRIRISEQGSHLQIAMNHRATFAVLVLAMLLAECYSLGNFGKKRDTQVRI